MEREHGPLRTTSDGGVTVVTIDHPPSNLVDGPLIGGLLGVLDAATADGARVLVFRSADADFFVMHGDVNGILAVPTGEHMRATEPNVAAATFQRLAAGPWVTIGLIDGAARGGGCELLSALDFRFGTSRTVIGQPEVPMGILPGAGGTARWPRVVGRSRALDILLTGRDIDADEALALGWLHALVPAEALEAEGMALARRVAAMPPASVAAVKRVVDISLAGLDAALVAESDALAALMASGAHHVPMRRFLAAGGQTRAGEAERMAAILDAMLEG
jgi:enoyl-CoA hydratase/carnithine racemase